MPNVVETTDAAGSASTTYVLQVGQTAQGTLSAGDSDWYRVDLVAGQQYTVALVGEGATTTAVSDTYLNIRNAGGTVLFSNDDGGPGNTSTVTFTASSTGTYYIDASGYDASNTGQYGVSVTAGARASYDEYMAAGVLMRQGLSWSSTPAGSATVTWSVSASNDSQTDASNHATPFIAPSQVQIDTFIDCLSQYSSVCNINFARVNPAGTPGGTSNDATIRLSSYYSTSDGAGAYAYYPGSTASTDLAGNVNLNNDSVSTTSIPQGSYSYFAILHELGHSMGLAHPGDYNAAAGVDITYANSAQFTQDSQQYTVMSYFDEGETTTSFGSYADGLLLFDILALQQLYGANMTTRTGDTVYGFNSNAGATMFNFAQNTDPVFCIWDAAGNDTIDASGFSQSQMINLNAGQFSNIGGLTGNISIAFGATIENAIGGSGSDTIYGNAAGNILDGRGGNDTLYGGAGDDTYVLADGYDTVVESSGTDTITSTITRSLTAYSGIENLTLLGSGNIEGYGNEFANTIIGNSGNNVLSGRGGIDTLNGGAGNDTYVLAGDNDIVIDVSGNDTITSTITRSLVGYSTIERLTLLGTGNINGTGNALNNVIKGNSGNNILDGGDGADGLDGGDGNDTYVLADGNDSIVDSSGIDTVTSTITRTLEKYATIEKLTLLGTGDINGIGNDLNNVIRGNSGKNTLNGGIGDDGLMGGLGNDRLTGGAGKDTFVFNTALNAATNVDTITDFSVVDDTIQLDNAIFTRLGAEGRLSTSMLAINTTGQATDANDRIIYESDTGRLYYDADGSGGASSAIHFATLTTGLAFTVYDFIII